jgi:hypothetical protein
MYTSQLGWQVTAVRLEWLHVVDDVRTRIIQNKEYFHVPDLKKIA